MSFLKRHWLYASVGLVVFLCVAIGAFLVWRANQPVESKTVYVMPEPNPERAEILKRVTQPKQPVYASKPSDDEATDAPVGEAPDALGDESSSQENEFGESPFTPPIDFHTDVVDFSDLTPEEQKQYVSSVYQDMGLEPPPPGYMYYWDNHGVAHMHKQNEPIVEVSKTIGFAPTREQHERYQ